MQLDDSAFDTQGLLPVAGRDVRSAISESIQGSRESSREDNCGADDQNQINGQGNHDKNSSFEYVGGYRRLIKAEPQTACCVCGADLLDQVIGLVVALTELVTVGRYVHGAIWIARTPYDLSVPIKLAVHDQAAQLYVIDEFGE